MMKPTLTACMCICRAGSVIPTKANHRTFFLPQNSFAWVSKEVQGQPRTQITRSATRAAQNNTISHNEVQLELHHPHRRLANNPLIKHSAEVCGKQPLSSVAGLTWKQVWVWQTNFHPNYVLPWARTQPSTTAACNHSTERCSYLTMYLLAVHFGAQLQKRKTSGGGRCRWGWVNVKHRLVSQRWCSWSFPNNNTHTHHSQHLFDLCLTLFYKV